MIYGGIFERYPNFPFVVPHTGGALLTVLERLDNGYKLFPDCRKHISRLPSDYARRLFYDTCSFYGPALMMAHQILGPQQLMWGSDDPFISADTAHVDTLALSDADKTLILGKNAARVFTIDGVAACATKRNCGGGDLLP
jgi:aminocarboxymuconate-semialdehyde decarboxylase